MQLKIFPVYKEKAPFDARNKQFLIPTWRPIERILKVRLKVKWEKKR